MKKLLLIPLILALFVLNSCERYSWRQTLTITVETPAGEVSGSSVSQVSWGKHWIRTDGMGWDYNLTGEAVVVEVAPGRYLFALLKGAGTTEYMGSVAAASIAGRESRVIDGDLFDEVRDKRDRAAGVITVPEYQYPVLATFGDITDPTTVRRVDPHDLDASFGCVWSDSMVRYPWREMGATYRDWVEAEVLRLSRDRAATVAGLPQQAAAALVETYLIADDHSYDAAEKQRLAVLRTQFTEDQRKRWEAARYQLRIEIPTELPTPQSLAKPFGGPCFKLSLVTLEITRDPATEGVVEDVLRWLVQAKFILPPEKQPSLIKYQSAEQMLWPSDFIDGVTLRAKREAN